MLPYEESALRDGCGVGGWLLAVADGGWLMVVLAVAVLVDAGWWRLWLVVVVAVMVPVTTHECKNTSQSSR